MRFFHCTDIHLDSPLRGQERYEGVPVEDVRGATRRAFENMVQDGLRINACRSKLAETPASQLGFRTRLGDLLADAYGLLGSDTEHHSGGPIH